MDTPPQEDLEYGKKMLADPNLCHKNISAIAMEAGFYEVKYFNIELGKDTDMCPTEYRAFHTQFKQVTGMSPQEYIARHGKPS